MKANRTYPIFIVLIVLFWQCEEKIIKDQLNPISLNIAGYYSFEGEIYPAAGGEYQLFLPEDTLSGVLDDQGTAFTGVIENSSQGFQNVRLRIFYNGQTNGKDKFFSMICCPDDLKDTIWNISPEEVKIIECDALNRNETITIKSPLQDCVEIGAEALTNNVYQLELDNDLRITWDSEIFYDNDDQIWVESELGSLNKGSNSVIISAGNRFRIYFDVKRDVFTSEKLSKVFLFDVVCLNEDGSEGESGQLELTVEAVLCDPTLCNCPVGADVTLVEDLRHEPVRTGDQRTVSVSLDALVENLAEDCQYTIVSVEALSENTTNAWNINTDELPLVLNHDDFNEAITATFIPEREEEYTEKFKVSGVMKAIDENNEQDSCFFEIEFRGKGCTNVPPKVRILSSEIKAFPAMFIDPGFMRPEPEPDDKVQNMVVMVNYDIRDEYIYQAMNVSNNSCDMLDFLTTNVSDFIFSIPDDAENCEDYSYKVNIIDNRNSGGNILAQMIDNHLIVSGFSFDSEDIGETFFLEFEVLVNSATDGALLYVQPFYFELFVSGVPYFDSGLLSIISYSNSSNLFGVNLYDEDRKGTFGEVVSLSADGVYGFIDGEFEEPNVNGYNFYIQTDESTGIPELYLVDDPENDFTHITLTPVQYRYDNHGDFRNAYFNGDFDPFLENYNAFIEGLGAMGKQGVDYPDGLELEEERVYILWNHLQRPENYNGDIYFCKAALMYVSEILEDAKDPSMNFYIQYPIGTFKNTVNLQKYQNKIYQP